MSFPDHNSRLQQMCFPVNMAKFLGNDFLQNSSAASEALSYEDGVKKVVTF